MGALAQYTRDETLLAVEHVSLQFGNKEILTDVNVSVRNLHRISGQTTGQVVAFLGPSGIGKSQLLRILAGLQTPTHGEVYLGPNRDRVRRGTVGMVSQRYTLFRNRTVLGNLMVAALQTHASRSEAKDRSTAMLDRFGLSDKADSYPQQLSGGMCQRVAIAQQLLCSEHFLLMDEPFSGLDPTNTNRVCKLIAEVANADDKNTIIVVTHDVPAAISVADTLWIMGRERDSAGKVISGAKIIEVYDLIERGLCWHPDVTVAPQFAAIAREIRSKFDLL